MSGEAAIKVKLKIVGILIFLFFLVGMGTVYYLWQHSTERQVQSRIDEFLQAIQDDPSKARDLWEIKSADRRFGMSERRERVISDLISAGVRSDYEVLNVVWWSTCCEPHPVRDSKGAGRAQMKVQLTDKNEHSVSYTFDISTREPYWSGDASPNNPVAEKLNDIVDQLRIRDQLRKREWVIRDIYLPDEGPLR